jgi:anti-anti-sigma factor
MNNAISQQRPAITTAGPREPGTLLSIDSWRHGSTHTISLRGELDLATVDDVERELLRVESSDARRIVLDLSGLSFMDSSGVHLVVDAHARCRADADRLRVVRGPRNVQRVFVLTDLHAHLPFVG